MKPFFLLPQCGIHLLSNRILSQSSPLFPSSVILQTSFLRNLSSSSTSSLSSLSSSSTSPTQPSLKSSAPQQTIASSLTTVEVHTIRLSEDTPASQKRRERRAKLRSELHQLDGTSLVEDSLREMEERKDEEGLSREELREKRRTLANFPSFSNLVKEKGGSLSRRPTTVFQINIGLKCNQACSHCHVESSPRRKEMMEWQTLEQCGNIIRNSPSVKTIDITGGAPELHPHFREFIDLVRAIPNRKLDIIDRCNLTVLTEPDQDDLDYFLASRGVHVIASLPCYGPDNVNKQRGNGVFDHSIAALLKLNDRGYGLPGSNLQLDLVYNPLGAFLPPDQVKLETQYKAKLDEAFGIQFNHLFCITNMPIKRFADFLYRRGELQQYMNLLLNNFNVATLDNVMCRDYLSVRYDGAIAACDFNQQLGMFYGGGASSAGAPLSVFDLSSTEDVGDRRIDTGSHCFGCTAGKGSSCQGEVA